MAVHWNLLCCQEFQQAEPENAEKRLKSFLEAAHPARSQFGTVSFFIPSFMAHACEPLARPTAIRRLRRLV
jgi:hypothetical protein